MRTRHRATRYGFSLHLWKAKADGNMALSASHTVAHYVISSPT